MSSETELEIPEQIENVMRQEEIENMRSLDGWAIGTVVQTDWDGEVVHRFDDAWVELFNGDGRAGRFGGVRFMTVDDGDYEEAYAYAGRTAAEGSHPCYYVETWTEPEFPEIGPRSPESTALDGR